MARITLNDVGRKHLKIIGYLLASGVLGWLAATYIADNPALTAVFAPAINYVLYTIEKELKEEGVIEALRKKGRLP